ncbi:olfactory receptor 52E2-like [Xenopus laevis]|uniref:Olfactory receptor 52E2-like n=2 Tax=Xenopus laevis TaxID=8355 RepID=A0A8J1M6F0_XENLA|nr:olfactory receptor 52E2-like [Xenopus laevis]
MENVFNTSTSFILLGIEEMEHYKYLYCGFVLVTYLLILLFSSLIISVVLLDESLHEPMYTLIANLMLNGIFGASCFLPKLILDLFLSSKVISRAACFIQSFCVTIFGYFEIAAFTIMAYDTYLAVCHPLRYPTLMTNKTSLKLIVGSVVFNVTFVLVSVLLSAQLPLCGSHINNYFCDNMSIFILSCVDSSVNRLYGTVKFVTYLMVSMLIIAYSYVRILHICLKISKGAGKKAIHTLVTHLLNFSIFLIGALFIFIRYRLENINLPLVFHILLSITGSVFPPLLNPLVYGIRTKALKIKVISHLEKLKVNKYF